MTGSGAGHQTLISEHQLSGLVVLLWIGLAIVFLLTMLHAGLSAWLRSRR